MDKNDPARKAAEEIFYEEYGCGGPEKCPECGDRFYRCPKELRVERFAAIIARCYEEKEAENDKYMIAREART